MTKNSIIKKNHWSATRSGQSLLISLGICGCLAWFNWTARCATPNGAQVLDLQVAISEQSPANVELQVTLKNTGSSTLSIPFAKLPWALYEMTVVVVGVDPMCQPLKHRAFIADGMSVPAVKIKSGRSLSGPIYLSDNFPDLLDTLKRYDVIVFWSYSFPTIENSQQRLSGSLVIPRIKLEAPVQEKSHGQKNRAPNRQKNHQSALGMKSTVLNKK